MKSPAVLVHDREDNDRWAKIAGPVNVVDPLRAQRNIDRMAEKARASGVHFRPHFKTHQSAAVGEWFRACGVSEITVSSVVMAQYFARHGWRDITIAFPVNPREVDSLQALGREIHLGLIVDSPSGAEFVMASGIPCTVWIDIDVGYHRTGVAFDDAQELVRIGARLLDGPKKTKLEGVLTHAGHSYNCRSRSELEHVYADSLEKMHAARTTLREHLGFDARVSVGDTPCCSTVASFGGVDEVRPGNFVFYDLQQLALGSCAKGDLALAVACPVVGVFPARGEIVIHGGAVHLSKDTARRGSHSVFGGVATRVNGAWELLPEDAYVSSVSQEHGVVTCPPDVLSRYRVGDLLYVIPAHACLAVSATGSLHDLDGRLLDADGGTRA